MLQSTEEKAEDTKVLTEYALITLVQQRLKYQSKFDNSSDTADAAWQHVHAAYNKVVSEQDGGAATDTLSVSQLKRRWNLEYGEFKLWCDVANRAIQLSGVPRDEVDTRHVSQK